MSFAARPGPSLGTSSDRKEGPRCALGAPAEREIYERRVIEARRRLDGSTFAVEWAHGRGMNLDAAVAFALGGFTTR
jgi:hypothetical protein